MRLTYSVRQLLLFYAYCKNANPASRVLPPGGRQYWDDMPARDWLAWFRDCLMAKCSRGLPIVGKGNRAAKRLQAIRDRKAECKWCGQLTGSERKRFCDSSCARSYSI